MKRLLALIFALVMAVTMLTGCGQPAEQAAPAQEAAAPEGIVLTLGNGDGEAHPTGMASYYFADKLAELSGGEMTVECYVGGVLGGDDAVTEAVMSGDLDICICGGGNVAAYVDAMNVFSIPFLFDDFDAYKAMLTSEEVLSYFDAEFQKSGFKLLALWNDGVRHTYLIDGFLETAEDFKGLKLRTETSSTIVSAFEAIGANPVPIAYTEVYTSLQQRVAVGAENNMNALKESKHYEVAPYITATGHRRGPKPIYMNLDKFNSLTAEQQDILMAAIKDTTEYEIETFNAMEGESLEAILADGAFYQEFPVEETAKLREAIAGVVDQVAEELGQEVVDLVSSFNG